MTCRRSSGQYRPCIATFQGNDRSMAILSKASELRTAKLESLPLGSGAWLVTRVKPKSHSVVCTSHRAMAGAMAASDLTGAAVVHVRGHFYMMQDLAEMQVKAIIDLKTAHTRIDRPRPELDEGGG